MKHNNSVLQQQIDEMDQYSLVAYMKLLGFTPTFENQEFTNFVIPLDYGLGATLVINNRLNRFRFTMVISNGGILDLASLVFRAKPEDILADLVPYKLDQLMSVDTGNKDQAY
jgi:hypothetical protein